MNLNVTERQPLGGGVIFDNHRSPDIGAERLSIFGFDRNVTGNADVLSLTYGVTKGGLDDIQWAGLDDISADYQIPITPYDTTIGVNYSRDDDPVTESPFSSLNITSETSNYSLSVTQPLIESIAQEFSVGMTFELRDNLTELLGEPFSFSPGADDGRTRVTALRLTQNFVRRSRIDSLSAHAQLFRLASTPSTRLPRALGA